MTQNENENQKQVQGQHSAWANFVALPASFHFMICFGIFSMVCLALMDFYPWAKAAFPYATGGTWLCILFSELHSKISKANAKLDAIQEQLDVLAPAQAGTDEQQ